MLNTEARQSARPSEGEFREGIRETYAQLKKEASMQAGLQSCEDALLKLLDARLFTVYERVANGKELRAVFRGGDASRDEAAEIKVPFSATSIAGYVALSQEAILVRDVNDTEEVADIHPRLQFDRRFSDARGLEIRSMCAVPIKDEILLGALQLMNFSKDREFDEIDLKRSEVVGQLFAQQFRASLAGSHGPYDHLVQRGLISQEDLAEASRSTETDSSFMASVLMETHGLDADAIGRSLELHYRVPYMPFEEGVTLPDSLIANISREYLRRNLWVPVSGDKQQAIVLIADPSNQQKIMEIQGLLNARSYVFRVGLPEHIRMFLREPRKNGTPAGFQELFTVLGSAGNAVKLEQAVVDESENDAPGMVQIVNRMIAEADRLGASDIHIEPGRDGLAGAVRIRVDGLCRTLLEIPEEHCAAAIARVKVISRLNIAERRLPQDGKCKLQLGDRKIEMRVATLPTVHGESVVMRLLTSGSPMELENLNLSAQNQAQIMTIAAQPHGLFLVVGPTGSGKTTTLHAVLSKLNAPEKKIWTAEDPVEITQDGLQQVQVQPKIDFTFAKAMRAFLRADPDVILIGEMRDQETANIAIEASLTGHLVLSTLHTNSAPETITRLLDLGLDAINFSDALLGVLAQRLLRTFCAHCKRAYIPDEMEKKRLIESYGVKAFKSHGLDEQGWAMYRAVGCGECGGTGYKGRMAIHEMLPCSSKLREMIYRRASLDEIRKQAVVEGMRTMRQDGIQKIIAGHSDYSQLLQVVGVAVD